MIRTFIAIEIPEVVQRQVSQVEVELRHPRSEVRWVKQENIHLTLKFLGDLGEETIERLAEGVREAVRGVPPFQASLSSLGVFPTVRSPRVVWVGVDQGREQVIALQKRIEEKLADLDFPKEERKFTPHITIGRVKPGKGTGGLTSKLDYVSFSSEPFRVLGVTIFQSRLTPQGPIYSKLKEIALAE